MLRAMTYTILFCGLSAGGAVALALAHNSSPFDTPAEPAIAAPNYFEAAPIQVARAEPSATLPMPAPVLSAPEPVAPVTVEAETPAPAPVAAPVASPIKKAATPVAKKAPAKAQKSAKARPAPKPKAAQPMVRQRVTVSTQGIGSWNGSTDFSHVKRTPIKRAAPQVSTQGAGVIDMSNTWMIGVYR